MENKEDVCYHIFSKVANKTRACMSTMSGKGGGIQYLDVRDDATGNVRVM